METTISPQRPLDERRASSRLKVQIPIHFRDVLKPRKPYTPLLSLNLSSRGIAVEASEFLPRNGRLVLLFSLPGMLRTVRVICRVAWVREKSFGEGCEGGLEFIEITPEDREAVAVYVERGTVVQPPR